MKKALLGSVVAFLASCVMSLAVVQISWNSTGLDITDVNGDPAAVDFFAQLIWTPDQLVSPLDVANPFSPTEGETVVADLTPLNGSGVAGAILNGQTIRGDDSLAGGYVYTRVFDSATSPMYFGNTQEPTGNPAIGGGLAIETTNPATITGNAHNPGVIAVNQLIPEPTTLALLVVGLGTVVYRRRR